MPKGSNVESLSALIHKKKKQEKNNKSTGQIDKLKKYGKGQQKSSDNYATDDKQMRREARYMKNIAIDETLGWLMEQGLVIDEQYHAWWCGVMHKLGVQRVRHYADTALTKGQNPPALFHFLINKEINKANDPHMPRFN